MLYSNKLTKMQSLIKLIDNEGLWKADFKICFYCFAEHLQGIFENAEKKR